MCATFFARTEVMCKDSNEEVKVISKRFNDVEASFINPAKVVDAKFFSLN